MSVFACRFKPIYLPTGKLARAVVDETGVMGVRDRRVFTQAQTFGLAASGLLLPSERIADSTNLFLYSLMSGIKRHTLSPPSKRTGEYGFYKKGFDKCLTIPFGEKIVWVENERAVDYALTGRQIVATLKIPKGIDVEFDGINKTTGARERVKCDLRDAYGLGVVPISKLTLSIDEDSEKVTSYTISFDSSLDPKDIRLVVHARDSYFGILVSEQFMPEATGWHASITHVPLISCLIYPYVTALRATPTPGLESSTHVDSYWSADYEVVAVSDLRALLQCIETLEDAPSDPIISSAIKRLKPLAERLRELKQKRLPLSDEDTTELAVCFEQATHILSIDSR